MKHTVVFTSWCPPATAQQNPTQAPPAKMQGPTWRSLSVGRTEKAGDNVVVENVVVTKKTLRNTYVVVSTYIKKRHPEN